MTIQGKGKSVWTHQMLLAFRPLPSGCSVSAADVGLVLSQDLLLAFVADIWSWWTQNAILLCSINSSLLTQPLLWCRRWHFSHLDPGFCLSAPPKQSLATWELREACKMISAYLWSFSPFHNHNTPPHGDTRSSAQRSFPSDPNGGLGRAPCLQLPY